MRSLLLYLLLFSLPFQTRTLLFAGSNEYQSAFLYASDILAAVLFLVWVFSQSPRAHLNQAKEYAPLLLPGIALLAWLVTSSILSDNPPLGLWRTIKVTEFFWIFYFCLLLPKPELTRGLYVLLGSGALQSAIALGQFALQHSVGLSMLGENLLSPDLAGVAKLDMGRKIMRAYGTFPHPNVLAAFLLFCIITLVKPLSGEIRKPPLLATWGFALLPLFLAGLLVTFSRVALATLFVLLPLWFFYRYKKKFLRIGVLLIASFAFLALLLFPYLKTRFTVRLSGQDVAFRVFYARTAFDIIRSHPIAGVGLGQFTAFQKHRIDLQGLPPYVNQPAHNIYLLFIAETGLVGLFLFYWFLHNLFYPLYETMEWRNALPYLILPLAIFTLGSFDHFFMSYQQGEFLFWLSLAWYANSFNQKV